MMRENGAISYKADSVRNEFLADVQCFVNANVIARRRILEPLRHRAVVACAPSGPIEVERKFRVSAAARGRLLRTSSKAGAPLRESILQDINTTTLVIH